MTTATQPKGRVQLLIDHVGTLDGRMLVERRESGKVVLRGEVGRADVVTSNNRLYPRTILEREIKRLQKEAKARRLYGELDHPADGRTQFQRVSHRIREISLEDDGRVIAEFEVIPTAKGNDLKAIIESGGAVGVSSRGTGTTHKREDGVDVVNEDYTLITYDSVADPAHSGAYPEVFFESKDVKNLGRVDMPKDSLEALVSENPELAKQIDALVKSEIDKVREKVRTEEQERLKGTFEETLLKQLGELRKEVEEDVRSEVASDPKWADAKRRLEAIRSVLGAGSENSVPKDQFEALQKQVGERDEQIKGLSARIEELSKKVDETASERDKLARAAKKQALEKYIEHAAQKVTNPSIFRELIKGYVSEDDDAETIKKKVEEKLELAKRLAERDKEKAAKIDDISKKIKEEVDKQLGEMKKQIEDLTKKNEALSEESKKFKSIAEKSLSVGKQGYTEALKHKVFEEKAATHPARTKIWMLLEQANLNTKDEIESFVDKLVRTEGRDSTLMERIRAKTARGESAALNEDGSEKKSLLTEKTAPEEKLFGVPLSHLRKLAGVPNK